MPRIAVLSFQAVAIGCAVVALGCGQGSAPAVLPSDRNAGQDDLPIVEHDIRTGEDTPASDVPPFDDLTMDRQDLGGIETAADGEDHDETTDTLVPGGKGWPCEDNSECSSGFCIDTPDGRKCTVLCISNDECDPDMVCAQVATYPDLMFACVWSAPHWCRPCVLDDDCEAAFAPEKLLCAYLGTVSYCLKPCGRDGSCPEGSFCKQIPTEGGKDTVCVPSSGTCECSSYSIAMALPGKCVVENEYGTCTGVTHCTEEGMSPCSAKVPAAESCNLVDDDCNGFTDDLGPGAECELKNAYGICKGTLLCVNGEEVCQGSYAIPEICNGIDDDCDGEADNGFPDNDEDGIKDCLDVDRDGDGIPNDDDNCPDQWNADQNDNDKDQAGDVCDPDDDNDLLPDPMDNCPMVWNPDQKDTDLDGVGNACDQDTDGDGVPDGIDNCLLTPNEDQADTDKDGAGDACDPDLDGDGVLNTKDNCLLVANQDQSDVDKDGQGDLCDPDLDGDTVPNESDNCPVVANQDQADTDHDLAGDACDLDLDGDGVPNIVDNCPATYNPDQQDLDGDGIGDACVLDWDGDTVLNDDDNCPRDYNPKQEDMDLDGQGNVCDDDKDGDAVANETDNCADIFNPGQEDQDSDGIGDPCDTDRDGDGDPNATDCAPADPSIHHSAQETCNGLDDDCDAATDEENANGCKIYYRDDDQDGFGTFLAKCLCGPSLPFNAEQPGDCNDKDAAVGPAAQELCGNSKDDNCNGLTDEEAGVGCQTWFKDADTDGWGIESDSKCLCKPAAGYTASKVGDCNDLDNTVFPGQTEKCNGKDDDCNGQTDEQGAVGCSNFLGDHDRDGFGVAGDQKCLCAPAAPYDSTKAGDCNDASADRYPGAPEHCNDLDDDCDGLTDEAGAVECVTYYLDGDNDGWGVTGQSKCLCEPAAPYSATAIADCNDSNSAVFPGAIEACNGLDDDCDAQVDEAGADGCSDFFYDNDGDGFGVAGNKKCLCAAQGKFSASEAGDCLDANKNVYPGATEVCNLLDDDCDGLTDEENALSCKAFYKDSDSDGFGQPGVTKCLCQADGEFKALQGGDCNDLDSQVFPGAVESCNHKDDNCNGLTDEDNAAGCTLFYLDNDHDGYGTTSRCLCEPSGLYTAPEGGDCKDSNASVHPGAIEACNSVDDDCDGQIDEADAEGCREFFLDRDQDGFGTAQSKCLCVAFGQYTALKTGDCDDSRNTVYPEANEVCNGIDDDCDAAVDEQDSLGCKTFYLDDDGDTYGVNGQTRCLCGSDGDFSALVGGDCDDHDAAIYPGATEVCNGHDDDCDSQTDEENAQGCVAFFLDADADTYGTTSKCLCEASGFYTASRGGDCNDLDGGVHPGATEACNGHNDDCDLKVDEEDATGCTIWYLDADSDTYGTTAKCLCSATGQYTARSGGDCNDLSAAIHPGAVETCNLVDDNCNGLADEENAADCTLFYQDADQDGHGTAQSKCLCEAQGIYTARLSDDCDDTRKTVYPGAAEACDTLDNDCDGQTDEQGALGCTAYFFDGDQDTFGNDGIATKCLCSPDEAGKYNATRGLDCDDANAAVAPGKPEVCNGIDDNCSGTTDEGFSDFDGDSLADCVDPDDDGDGDPDTTDCADHDASISHFATDVCNGRDDDCDGEIDESNGACAAGSVCFNSQCRAKPASYCSIELYAGHLYAFCPSGLISWDSADAICSQWGATQVVINDSAEHQYVRSKVGGARTWLGYSDRAQEGVWVWEDGGSSFAPPWCPGEPNDMTNEDCAELNWGSNGCWNDCECPLFTQDCTATTFVCEMH